MGCTLQHLYNWTIDWGLHAAGPLQRCLLRPLKSLIQGPVNSACTVSSEHHSRLCVARYGPTLRQLHEQQAGFTGDAAARPPQPVHSAQRAQMPQLHGSHSLRITMANDISIDRRTADCQVLLLPRYLLQPVLAALQSRPLAAARYCPATASRSGSAAWAPFRSTLAM